MKATLKGKYESIKTSATASVSVDANVGDVKIKTTVTDVAAVTHASPLPYALSFSLQKPGSFSVDYSPQKDVKFQFLNSMKVLKRAVNLTYTHARGENRTTVDGAVAFDAGKKVAVSHVLGTNEWTVRCTYAHGAGALRRTVIEPCYSAKSNTLSFAVSRKFEGGDAVKATYWTSSRILGLPWTRDSPMERTLKLNNITGFIIITYFFFSFLFFLSFFLSFLFFSFFLSFFLSSSSSSSTSSSSFFFFFFFL